MADNKFGLSDALINAVRQVAENSAPLPRDERERDLARQATMKPKSLDEAAAPKKKGIVDATIKKITKEDPVFGAGLGLVKTLASKIAKKVISEEEVEVLNELSPELLKRAELAANKKMAAASNDRVSDAFGGKRINGMNPLANHYDKQRKKFAAGAEKAKTRDAVKAVGASDAALRKVGLKKEQIEVGDTSDVYFYEKRLSPKQKKLASLAGNPNDIEADDLKAARAGKMREEAELDEVRQTKSGIGDMDFYKPGGTNRPNKLTPDQLARKKQEAKHLAAIKAAGGKGFKEEAELNELDDKTIKRYMIAARNSQGRARDKIHPHSSDQTSYTDAEKDKAKKTYDKRARGLASARWRVDPLSQYSSGPSWGPRDLRSRTANEEVELEEAKVERKPLTPEQKAKFKKAADRRASMSKAAQAKKPQKPQAYVHPEPDVEKGEPKGRENETPTGEKETHIVMAARKAVSLGEYPFTFENGKTHIIDKSTGRKIIAVHGNQKDKSEFEARLRSSHEGMKDALKNPDNAPVKRDTKAERLAPKPLRPDFMQRLDQMAAAHAARQKNK